MLQATASPSAFVVIVVVVVVLSYFLFWLLLLFWLWLLMRSFKFVVVVKAAVELFVTCSISWSFLGIFSEHIPSRQWEERSGRNRRGSSACTFFGVFFKGAA